MVEATPINIPIESIVILLIFIIVVAILISSFIRHSVRLFIAGIVILILLALFTWIPQKTNEWLGGEKAPEFTETLGDTTDGVKEYVNDNKDSWLDTLGDVWNAIFN